MRVQNVFFVNFSEGGGHYISGIWWDLLSVTQFDFGKLQCALIPLKTIQNSDRSSVSAARARFH